MAAIFEGYLSALRSAGLPTPPEMVSEVHDFAHSAGEIGASNLLDLDTPPTAIITLDDPINTGAMQAIEQRGLRVPDDIAIVCYQERPGFAVRQPRLTTVKLPAYEMGQSAYKLLRRLIGKEEVEEKEVV